MSSSITPPLATPNYPKDVLEKARSIRLVICDVDGVLSNGQVIIGNSGEELKTFNIKDGLGLKNLQRNGIEVAIITGRRSNIVEQRCQELGIRHVFQGQVDKIASFNQLCDTLSIAPNEVCHIGDDLPDLAIFKRSGLGITVADGHWFVQQEADWIAPSHGGFGAVREISDMILSSKNLLDDLHQGYLA